MKHATIPGMARRANASTLLLAVWALLVISTATFAWVRLIDQGMTSAREASLGLEAKALAHSGLAVALNPKVSRKTPLLVAAMGPNRGYEATITGEAGKLNINHLLEGEDPARLDVLRRYLAGRGLAFDQSARLIDSMLDWIDPDNIRHLNGAEEEPNYHPPNRGRIISLDEISQIKGSEPLVSQGGWRDDLTIYGGGLIDLQYASQRVLESLPGISDAQAARFLEMRRGPDKIDGTEDDRDFSAEKNGPAIAASYLGIFTPEQKALVTAGDQTVHILSVGHAGKVYRQVEVVALKVGGRPQFLSWKEN